MGKKIFINALYPEESRVAIIEEGVLSEYEIEFAGHEQHRGNIYKGIVTNTEPGLQAAFVNYGGERYGFLQISEVNLTQIYGPDHPGTEGYPRIEQVLKPRQELLVQVVKDERGSKGAALTTYISLPGRYMVLMPFNDTRGVSRKIDSEAQRRKIKEIMASFDLPEHTGYIVRTAAVGRKKEELRKDIDYLLRINDKVQELYQQAKAPALIYQESNMVIRFLRDYFDTNMDAVVVDNPKVFHKAKGFFQDRLPEYAGLVKLHRERRPIFSRYQIEEQIAAIAKNKVALPSGGSIVIDVTEALVAIDVNSGKTMSEGDIEKTAFKTNMEAATEIARQLRLRDLGGLIVIDLIDMREKANNRQVEKNLKEALGQDKARVNLGRISKFGLLEMSRQRIKTTLGEKSLYTCPYCGGSGQLKRVEALAVAFLRKLEAGLVRENSARIEGETALETAHYLLNNKRGELADLEKKYKTSIVIKGRPDLKPDDMEITFQKIEKPELPKPPAEETKPAQKTEDQDKDMAASAPKTLPEAPAKAASKDKEESRKKSGTRRPSRRKTSAKDQKNLPAPAPAATTTAETPAESSPTTAAAIQPAEEEKTGTGQNPETTTGATTQKTDKPAPSAATEKDARTGVKTNNPAAPQKRSRPRRKPTQKTEQKEPAKAADVPTPPTATGKEETSTEATATPKAAKPPRSRSARTRPTPKGRPAARENPEKQEETGEKASPSSQEASGKNGTADKDSGPKPTE
jgi:ribonuclease E